MQSHSDTVYIHIVNGIAIGVANELVQFVAFTCVTGDKNSCLEQLKCNFLLRLQLKVIQVMRNLVQVALCN